MPEYICHYQCHRTGDGKRWWFIDCIKLVVNDLENSTHYMLCGRTPVQCLMLVPDAILAFIEFGMDPVQAALLVKNAVRTRKQQTHR